MGREKFFGMERSLCMKWLFCIFLAGICFVIPEQGLYTQQVKFFLSITVFALALSAFELVSNFIVAILMPALWAMTGVAPVSTIMSSWTSSTILMLIGAFFMAASLEDCGLLRRIAFYLMCKVRGSYFVLLFTLMVVTIIMNIITFGNAYIIMPPLALGLCISLGGMKKKLGAGIAAAVMLGGATSHSYTYHAPAWGVILEMGKDYLAPGSITPFSIMMHNWPLFFISICILFIAYKMYQPEEKLGDIGFFQKKLEEMGPVTRREKVNTAVMIILLCYVFTVNLTGFDLNLGFATIPLLLFLPFVDGADEKTIEKTNLQMIFFVASCMAIGTVATSLGLGDAIAGACMKVLHGNTNPMMIIGIIFAIVFILNFLMTPMAIWSLITIPLLSMVVQFGYSPVPFAYAINACAEAVILPYEYVPYLIIFSFGMMKMKDFVVFNIIRSVTVLLGIVFIMTAYWHVVGLL